MGKRRFHPEPWKKKETGKKTLLLELQRQSFDKKANQPFHWVDISRLSLLFEHVPKGYVKSIMVMFDNPIEKELVKVKLEEAFG